MAEAKIRETVITSTPDGFSHYLIKLWDFFPLVWEFARRDLTVKYAQTYLGLTWSLIQPLTGLFLFTFFFHFVLNWEAEGMPYPVYLLSGLLGWNFFTYIVHSGTSALQESGGIIRKIAFPKSIVPISKVFVGLVELMISAILLIPLLWYFDYSVSINILLLPLVVFLNALCGLALVFWANVFAYRRRDVYHLVPFITYFGIWVTPVFFIRSQLPDSISWLLKLNPMSTVVDLWRFSLFNNGSLEIWHGLTYTVIIVLTLLGMWFYHRKEPEFTDYA